MNQLRTRQELHLKPRGIFAERRFGTSPSWAWLGAVVVGASGALLLLGAPAPGLLYTFGYLVVIGLIAAPSKVHDWVRVDVFALLAFGLYTLPVVFNVSISGVNIYIESEELYRRYLALTLFFELSLAISFRFIVDTGAGQLWRPPWPLLGRKQETIFAVTIAVLSALVCLVYIPQVLGGVQTIARTSRGALQIASESWGLIVAFFYVFNFGIIMIWNAAVQGKRSWGLVGVGLLLAVPYVALHLTTGDRKYLVFLFIGTSAIALRHRLVRPVSIVVLLICAIFVLNGFRKVRDVRGDISDYVDHVQNHFHWDWFAIEDSEFSGHFLIAEHVMRAQVAQPPQFGFTYLAGLINLIPRFVYRDERFASPALTFAQEYDRTYAAEGGAFAYSFVLEAFQNFSYVGPWFIGGIVGVVLALHESWARQSVSAFSWTVHGTILGLLVILPRTEFASLIKFYFASCVVPLVLWYIYALRLRIR